MLIDRYPPAGLFALVPKLYVDFEPVLRELDCVLEDDVLVQRVKAGAAKRAQHSLTLGRPSTPVEAILRLLVVKRLYNWSYEEVEHFVSDSAAGSWASTAPWSRRISTTRRTARSWATACGC